MTYEQTQKLIQAMTEIETFAEGHHYQLSKEDTDWEMVDKCKQYIHEAKETIFNMLQDAAKGA